MSMNEQATKERGRKEGRSPSYPAISLGAAIERAQIILDKEKRHYAPITAIFTHWGYGPKSSMGILLLAALKKYGLVEDRGAGDSREARITELAWKILTDDRPNSEERAALLREAALNPSIHQKLWRDYDGQLPSDENLKHRLVHEDKFTRGAVDDFVRQLRATIRYANLEESDTLLVSDEDKPPTEEDRKMPSTRDISQIHQTELPPPPIMETLGIPDQEFKLALSEGKSAYIKVPHTLGKADWIKINNLLKVLKPSDLDSIEEDTND